LLLPLNTHNLITTTTTTTLGRSNAVIMLVDVAVSRLPLYARHFYMPFLYTLVYSVFNGVYVGAGGKDSVGRSDKQGSRGRRALSLSVFQD
jgi:hypothetical protein